MATGQAKRGSTQPIILEGVQNAALLQLWDLCQEVATDLSIPDCGRLANPKASSGPTGSTNNHQIRDHNGGNRPGIIHAPEHKSR